MCVKLSANYVIKFLVILILFIFATVGNTNPRVVSSIKPVQLLVAAVADGLVDSQLLLSPSTSPHLYHLRPSDQSRLHNADLVVWIGPDLERFLAKTLSMVPSDEVLELGAVIDQSSIVLTGGNISANDYRHNYHGHSTSNRDSHFWLDPILATKMAKVIADKLSYIDPDNYEHYSRNWQQFNQRMKSADENIRKRLKPVLDQRYVVLHDAYGHFERRYGLHSVAALTISPDRKPGVKRLLEITGQIRSRDIRCIFREPQYQLAIENMIYEQSQQITIGLLDPLASDITVSAAGYEEFLLAFSAEFTRCLTPQ